MFYAYKKEAHPRITHYGWPILLLFVVTLAWCTTYNRWTTRSWKTPVVYFGDALAGMAQAKAVATGEVVPILPKYPLSFGAPFCANWNDYPTPEEGVYAWWGLLIRAFGVFTGSNLALLSAHLLAAGSFYFVCRMLAYRPIFSATGAILFSMSHYAFLRNLGHLPLTFYWHVPLGLLVTLWCVGSESIIHDRKKIALCILVAIVHGFQNPYYTGIFAQFLLAAALYHLLRGWCWSRAAVPLFLLCVLIGTFTLANADTFYFRIVNGPNTAILTRTYSDLERYALKPIELFLPAPHHVRAVETWVDKVYIQQALYLGEAQAPYLGIIAMIALGALVWRSIYSLVNSRLAAVPLHFWCLLWVFVYSVIGGLNGAVGLFGFVLFRGTNRYSVVILALVLLFFVRELTRLAQRWNRWVVSAAAAIITLFGLWDQTLPAPTGKEIARIRREVLSDGNFVSTIEAKLPIGAMLFELPVTDFPEVAPIRNMTLYEPLRSYLYSKRLRFAYGSHKGRTRERWQKETERFEARDMTTVLERYGFGAILLSRRGYDDGAASIIAALRAAGRTEILADSPELVCIALQPSPQPSLPPDFDSRWYDLEGTARENWRWSGGDAEVRIYNPDRVSQVVHASFALESLKPRNVAVYHGPQKIYDVFLNPAESQPRANLTLTLAPGINSLLFKTDAPAEIPGNGDPRKLAFNLRNFMLVP